MNLDIISPRNESEDLLLRISKNCETLIEQTQTEPQEVLDFKLTQPRETVSFKTSINLDLASKWLVGLTSLEVYNSIINITTGIFKI